MTHHLAADVWTEEANEPPQTRCIIVQARGLLFDLYALTAAAYVGGGFRPRRLHAVSEPAAYGLPVVFGPHYQDFPDAMALMRCGGAVGLPRRGAATALAETWLAWLGDDGAKTERGLEARRTLVSGAATASAERLLPLLPA